MTTITQAANTTFRDLEAPGSALEHKPPKPEIRALFAMIDGALATIGLTGGVGVVYETEAELAADLAHEAGVIALVYNDPDPALNGYYVKDGASGAGGWTITPLALPANFSALLSAFETELQAVRDTVEAGELGDLMGAGGEYQTRPTLSDQPVAATDLGDAADYQILHGDISTDPRWDSAIDGDELVITSNYAGTQGIGAGTPIRIQIGNIYEVTAVMDTLGGVLSGVALGLVPQPTPGAADATMSTASCLLLARCDGAVTAYDRNCNSVFSGASFTPGGGGTAFGVDIPIRMVFEPLTSTTGILQAYVDDVPMYLPAPGKTFTFPFDIEAMYLFGGFRLFQNGDVARLQDVKVYAKSADIPSRIYVNGLTPPGGAGTRASPFETLQDAVKSYTVDTSRRTMALRLKGGILTGNASFAGDQYDEITIRSEIGERAEIDCTVPMAVTFTQIGATPVWTFDTPTYLGTNGYGGPVEVTSGVTQTFGIDATYGHTVEGFRMGHRTPIGTDPALLLPGSYARHLTGTYAGKTVLRWFGDVDPNGLDWVWSRYDNGLQVTSSTTGWNVCRVNVENIDIFGAFANGLIVSKVKFDLTDVRVRACLVASGFELDKSYGRAYGLLVEGSMADAYHAQGGAPRPTTSLLSEFWDCWAKGTGSFPTPINGSSYTGDGYSNHDPAIHKWILRGGGGIGAGKDIISTVGGLIAHDVLLQGAVNNGFSHATGAAIMATDGILSESWLSRATLRGNGTSGIVLNVGADGAGAEAIMRVDDLLFDSNAVYSGWIFNGAGPGNALGEIQYDPNRMRYVGAVPSFGSDWRNQDGTLTPLVTRAVAP